MQVGSEKSQSFRKNPVNNKFIPREETKTIAIDV